MTDPKGTIASIQSTLDEAASWSASCPAALPPLLEWALPDTGPARLQQAAGRLREAAKSFRRPLRVAVCGENNAGKSSLINLLLGEAVAVTDFFEFTYCPMVFAHGPTRAASIVFTKGDPRPVELPRLEPELRALKERGEEAT